MASPAAQAPAAPAHAEHQAVNHMAFAQAVTVKQALTLKDDSKVELKGHVVKALGDEKYEFRDSTGSMTVEIDDKLWHGKKVSAKTPVTLSGEVDIDYKPAKHVSIDVDALKF
ncbi:NirD/YgiW/YdeI family stress tolerance protein [Acinetobacter sp. WCHAc010034]|uniref:NirD/YgiW/YdeI family stress tolerance protein n=2 Tax=unclassified Acinetobacter TaxID=196816 RepID=UPI003A4E008B